MSVSPTSRSDEDRPHLTVREAEMVEPFVAWMATQDVDPLTRRRHRRALEAFLCWRRADDGPADGRRERYARHLAAHRPGTAEDARAGLDAYARYRTLRALTLPVGEH